MSGVVAPRVGAWIETRYLNVGRLEDLSHPVWVRGLKLSEAEEAGFVRPVAPRVGAWIETKASSCSELNKSFILVAPRVGAWIETLLLVLAKSLFSVAPRVGAWIETLYIW